MTLFPNEDIHQELKRACKKHQVETAVVLSSLDQLKQFQPGYPSYYKETGNYKLQESPGSHELLFLTCASLNKKENAIPIYMQSWGDERKIVLVGHLMSS